jgi:hypothetical protein
MLRAFAFASVLALTASAALAQPPGDPNGYGAQPTAQQPYPQASQGYPQGGGGAGYGAPGEGASGYGQGGGGRGAGDPETRNLRHRMRDACAADLSTYCAGAGQAGGDARQGDRRALHQCMMANQTRFSPPCQQAIADLQAHMRDSRMGGEAPGGGPPGAMPPAGAYAPPSNQPPQQYPMPPQ